MKGFWSNEWNLFLQDMQELGKFFLQPVEITMPGKSKPQMLKPTVEETKSKANEGGFWSNEWNSFLNDMESIGDFCMQPVEITMPGQNKPVMNSCDSINVENQASQGFWSNEWDLFKQDLRDAKEFLTQPVEFK